MSLAPHFQKQHRHGQFLLDFGLLDLPGFSERDIHSIYHCYTGFCKTSSFFSSTYQVTAQDTVNIKSPLCTASGLHLTGGLAPSLQMPKASQIHGI